MRFNSNGFGHRRSSFGLFSLVPKIIAGVFVLIAARAGLEAYWSTADKHHESIEFELLDIKENRGGITSDSDGHVSQDVRFMATVYDMTNDRERILEIENNIFRGQNNKNALIASFTAAYDRGCTYSAELSHPESFPIVEVYKRVYKAEQLKCAQEKQNNTIRVIQ